jgi:hypothetical protein
MNCGAPDTQRDLQSSANNFNVDKIFFTCKDHLMSSMGDVDGYSIIWFAPKAQFSRTTHKKVSWDVNTTDLEGRQWWEVSIVPVGSKFLATIDWLAGTAGIDEYHKDAVIIGSGPFGNTVSITTNKQGRYDGWQALCGDQYALLNKTQCADKMTRRPFSVTDNDNGTLTINYGGIFTQTVPGRLPDNYEVYFKDHNYTPDKDDMPIGHTWHWDSIRVE